MKVIQFLVRGLASSIVLTAIIGSAAMTVHAENGPSKVSADSETGSSSVTPPSTGAIALVAPASKPENDPCRQSEVAANATRPAWDYAASTTQCGVIESDFGYLGQPIGGGVGQKMLVSSTRYGLTPKLDLRWGVTDHMWQSGGGTPALAGIGDQWIGGRYRFHEQGKVSPALAFLYSGKIPTANPEKGFGTGYVDHQMILIASRDIGKNHFDFNAVGTLAGGPKGDDGAVQYGLALTRPLNKKLSAILESYGGPQPGTPDRFGAVFVGSTYTVRPQLVLDAAFTETYTAGSPRRQYLFGVTYARRAGFAPVSHRFAPARWLGR